MTGSYTIETMTAAEFAGARERLAREGRCAVVTDLFRGQPIAALASIGETRALMGSTPIVMSRNYADSKLDSIKAFLAGRKPRVVIERQPTTLSDYLDLVAREPDTRWIIAELPVPAHVLALADLGVLGIGRVAAGYADRTSSRARGEGHAIMFVANRTNASDLHSDWDGQDVLLYQGFGRKRVTVFPAKAAPWLHPIDLHGTMRLGSLPEATRRRFLDCAEGVEHLLEPGQAMFMPAYCWHDVEYLDLALSISFRFGGVEDPDVLFAVRELHRDFFVQNLIVATRDPAKAEASRAAILRLRQEFDRPFPSARAKYRVLRALARQSCVELGLIFDGHSPPAWIDFEDLLDGAQCTAYHELRTGAPFGRWWWHTRERGRSLVRRMATRVAHWA